MTDSAYLLDASVLVALTSREHVHHDRAREWFGAVSSWATTPLTEAAFVRLMLNPAVAGTQRSSEEVLGVLRALRARPGHEFLPDDSSLADARIELAGLVGHQQVTDLHLVNLAREHGMTLATFDARIGKALVSSDHALVALV